MSSTVVTPDPTDPNAFETRVLDFDGGYISNAARHYLNLTETLRESAKALRKAAVHIDSPYERERAVQRAYIAELALMACDHEGDSPTLTGAV